MGIYTLTLYLHPPQVLDDRDHDLPHLGHQPLSPRLMKRNRQYTKSTEKITQNGRNTLSNKNEINPTSVELTK